MKQLFTLLYTLTCLMTYAQIILTPISGADGLFDIVTINGEQVYKSRGTAGNYAPYIYLQTNEAVINKTVYVELTFLDIGNGVIFIDYNAPGNNYKNASGKNSTLLDGKGKKTMVFELKNANFKNGQNLGADLRIYSPTSVQKHLISAKLYFDPTQLWKDFNENYFGLYSGRKYIGPDEVDATTLDGKTICGYQGWFRVPGDPADQGWVHFCRNQDINDPTVEMWPDMSEYTDQEKYPVTGWTLKDGSPATLFSSANKRTVLRHFQWMQAYGIDGVAVQRFVGGLYPGFPKEYFRIPAYAREAANRTGRTFYIMYDQSGVTGTNLVEYVKRDWKLMVDSMKIIQDSRYLHHKGKPVVSIFGFFTDRFSPQIANQLLDIFKQPGYEAYVIGSGQHMDWDTPGWSQVYGNMGAYTPWNVGNYTSSDLDNAFAYTGNWPDQKQRLEDVGCTYMPLIFPGFGWDNLMKLPIGKSKFGRRKGEVMWQQIIDAYQNGASAHYIAMFDEIDESTAIFKITNNIPKNHYFTDYEGLPSDFYLSLAGYATKVLKGQKPLPASMPDFAKMSQPPIPDVIYPLHLDTTKKTFDIIWSAVNHSSGILHYELKIDDEIYKVMDTHYTTALPEGLHNVAVRAYNGLGNYSGWSELNDFVVKEVISTSIEDYTLADQINIYPNPFSDLLYINMDREINTDWQLTLTAMDGRILYHEKYNSTINSVTLSRKEVGLNNGVYLCKIKLGSESKVIKVAVL